jgi:hypothetical protein
MVCLPLYNSESFSLWFVGNPETVPLAGWSLHFFEGCHSKKRQRGDDPNFDESTQLQQEFFLRRVAFRDVVAMVVEEIEGLRARGRTFLIPMGTLQNRVCNVQSDKHAGTAGYCRLHSGA